MSALSEIYFTVGGYKIYLTLILLVVGVLIAFFLFLVLLSKLFKKKKQNIEISKNEEYSRISSWHREALPVLLRKYNIVKENQYILDYMEEYDVWYAEEIMDVDKDIIMRLDEMIFQEVKSNIKTNSYCFLLLNMMDRINGGLGINFSTPSGKIDWISSNLIQDTYDLEGKFKFAVQTALNYATEQQIYQNPDFIPQTIASVAENDLWDYSDNDYAILIVSFITYIQKYFIGNELDDIGLSYIRILASLFDRNDYAYSIESLED